MSTRATRLSLEHVSALNMIDIEFYGQRIFGIRFQGKAKKKVTNAWKIYNDHLNVPFTPETFQAWNARGTELFTTMLYMMSQALGYDFDEVQLKRDCYRPKGHGELEETQNEIRTGVLNILTGKKSLSMTLTNFPENSTNSTLGVESE